MIKTTQIPDRKNDFVPLLRLADNDETSLNSYLDSGDLYALQMNGETVCAAVVTEVSSSVCELRNIASYENCRNKGYAAELIRELREIYKGSYAEMIAGCPADTTSFFLKQGFKVFYLDRDLPDNSEEKYYMKLNLRED